VYTVLPENTNFVHQQNLKLHNQISSRYKKQQLQTKPTPTINRGGKTPSDSTIFTESMEISGPENGPHIGLFFGRYLQSIGPCDYFAQDAPTMAAPASPPPAALQPSPWPNAPLVASPLRPRPRLEASHPDVVQKMLETRKKLGDLEMGTSIKKLNQFHQHVGMFGEFNIDFT